MPDSKEKAAPDWHQEAARMVNEPDAIFAPRAGWGNCLSCGSRIRLMAGATTCPTCSAWRRWYSAHRIASGALREVER